MRNPISTKELSPAALGCGNPGGAPATPQQLAMLMQPPSPPADTAMPDARDSGSDGGNGGGGNKNTVKMPPMGVRISMTIGGERWLLRNGGGEVGGGDALLHLTLQLGMVWTGHGLD